MYLDILIGRDVQICCWVIETISRTWMCALLYKLYSVQKKLVTVTTCGEFGQEDLRF